MEYIHMHAHPSNIYCCEIYGGPIQYRDTSMQFQSNLIHLMRVEHVRLRATNGVYHSKRKGNLISPCTSRLHVYITCVHHWTMTICQMLCPWVKLINLASTGMCSEPELLSCWQCKHIAGTNNHIYVCVQWVLTTSFRLLVADNNIVHEYWWKIGMIYKT